MSSRATFAVVFALLAPVAVAANVPAGPSADAQLEGQFKSKVHPFLQTYCLPCHGVEKQEAELNLSDFTSVEKVLAGHGHWELVLERLAAGDMPSDKAKKFPTDREREEIVAWIHALRKNEGAKNAGDPGIVLARRLSNAEYDYTIRDLTGVDLRPTKEFPVDPANQAGFDNSGESLAMSPALLKKYFGAARMVSEHLVLTPDGFEFAPHPVVADTDRDKYSVLRIVDFYKRQPTDLADYFAAAWRYQHRAALGRPAASLADIAAENKVSAKYLTTVWTLLNDPQHDFGPLAKLRGMWRALPAPSAAFVGASLDDARGRRQAAPLQEAVHAGAEQMRDYVLGIREKIVPVVKNLTVQSIQNGSQTMVLWKNRQMAANRRKFDPTALHVFGAPAAVVEEKPALAQAAPTDAYAPAKPANAPTAAATKIDAIVNQVADRNVAQASPPAPSNASAGGTPALPQAAPAVGGTGATPSLLQPANASPNSEIIQRGGKFLAPAITTTGSSATFKMAASKNRGTDADLVVPADPAERAKHEAAFARFADVFPDAFYITERARVYLDAEKEQKLAGRLLSAGLHSMTGYFRDDGPLYDLVLDEAQQKQLDRLWREFDFYAAIPVRMHTSFVWFERTDSSYMRDPEFDPYRPEDKSVTTQEKIKKLGELYLAKAVKAGASETAQNAIKDHFARVAASNLWLDQAREAAVPHHLKALERFASRAYRRPLTSRERDDIAVFYKLSREENGLDHEDAMRDGIVRVLMSPHFCYRVDLVEAAGERQAAATGGARAQTIAYPQTASALPARSDVKPLSDYALASRLSYFLWSSMPDDELLARAAAGELQRPDVLAAQARRMLKDPRARNFATEFAGNWLDFRRFEEHNAVDRERFPNFTNELRTAMFEEPLRFFSDIVANDRSIHNFLYSDYTFVNGMLAQHYGMPAPKAGADEWVRVERASEYGRGGLLPMAVFLTANSPGLRTSPVKRGYWVVRRVLGERIPPPPAVVPELPNDEKNLGDLTLRDALAKHREDKSCASCHARFDSFGLVFEGFGPTGERRTKDFGGRAVDTRAPFPGGSERQGLPGLRDYIKAHRENDFADNLARKLLAYALGRSLLLSDDSLLVEMKTKLAASDYRFGSLVETIVTSPQFRTKRAPAPAVVMAPVKTAANN